MSKNNLLISSKLSDFYNQTSEEERLTIGLGPLEFERNKELILRHISREKIKIIDVGGGTGKYSEWLANLGHEVWMIDPVKKHTVRAKKRAEKLKNRFQVLQGEARNLEFDDCFADLVIMHGPLYHLQDKHERQKAILEAKRVTKPGGIILGFAINYTASTLVSLLQGMIHEPGIFNMCTEELKTGMHNAPENMPGILTEAYYHRPDEIIDEFVHAGLADIQLFAVEGIIWLDKNYFSSRADNRKYQNLLEISKLTEGDRNLIAFSPHMMVAGRK